MKYVKCGIAARQLGVHVNTLRNWANEGKVKTIRTPGNHRLYAVESLVKEHDAETICYCRVSSQKQRDDLERQAAYMREKYPSAVVVCDIGSGLNFKRKGLRSILERLLCGDVLEIVVANRDRLARFGFDLIQFIAERNGGKIVVLDGTSHSPEEELTKDLLTILHVFSCRMHGLRKYKVQVKADSDLPHGGSGGDS